MKRRKETRTGPTVADLGERRLLAKIARIATKRARGVSIGIGDDAAVLEMGRDLVVSSDLLVEGIDFDFAWCRWSDVGHKAAAVNLSDLAAMGSRPRGLVASVAVRDSDRASDLMTLIRSLAKVGEAYGAPLVGGDLSRTTGPRIVSVTALGERAGDLLRRRRAGPGAIVCVSGPLGGAACGLAALRAGFRSRGGASTCQLRPTPRVALGLALARSGQVQAAVDISDGLAGDALHLCRPGCGVVLDGDAIPVHPALRRALRDRPEDAIGVALSGGEDFELAIAVEPDRLTAVRRIARRAGAELSPVGVVRKGSGLRVVGIEGPLEPFDHFAAGKESDRE